jgi:hypothetical protein
VDATSLKAVVMKTSFVAIKDVETKIEQPADVN